MPQPFLYLIITSAVIGVVVAWIVFWAIHLWHELLEAARLDECYAQARSKELANDRQWQLLVQDMARISRNA